VDKDTCLRQLMFQKVPDSIAGHGRARVEDASLDPHLNASRVNDSALQEFFAVHLDRKLPLEAVFQIVKECTGAKGGVEKQDLGLQVEQLVERRSLSARMELLLVIRDDLRRLGAEGQEGVNGIQAPEDSSSPAKGLGDDSHA